MESPLTATLVITGYLAIGFLATAIGSRFDDTTEVDIDTVMFMCVLWSAVLVCLVVYGFFVGLGRLFQLVSGGTRITSND